MAKGKFTTNLAKHRIREALRYGKEAVFDKVILAKGQLSGQDAWDFARWFIRDLPLPGTMLWRSLPSDLSALRVAEIPKAPTPLDELYWGAAILASFSPAIHRHWTLTSDLSRAILIGENERAEELLIQHEKELGPTFWGLENRVALIQRAYGLQEQKTYVQEVSEKADDSFISLFADMISQRNEESVNLSRFLSEFRNVVNSKIEDAYYRTYLMYRFAGVVPDSLDHLATIVRYELSVSPIDLYETFLLVTAHALGAFPGAAPEIAKVLDLIEPTGDFRLDKLKFLAGCRTGKWPDARRPVPVAEKLVEGNWAPAALLAVSWLEEDPTDMEAAIVRARCCALLGTVPTAACFRDELVSSLARLYLRDDLYSSTFTQLQRWALNFRWMTFAPALGGILAMEQGSPWFHGDGWRTAARAGGRYLDVGDLEVLGRTIGSRAAEAGRSRLAGTLSAAVSKAEEGGGLGEEDSAGVYRPIQVIALAKGATKYKDWQAALNLLTTMPSEVERLWRLEATSLQLECLVKLGDIGRAVRLITSSYLTDPNSVPNLPVKDVLQGQSYRALETLADDVDVLIALDLYLRLQEDEAQRANLRYLFEEFFMRRRVERPSELLAGDHGLSLEQEVYFLRYICVPSTMDVLTGIGSSRALMQERIGLCGRLAEIDPANARMYQEESRSLATAIRIDEGLRFFDQSRVHVDTEGLTRWANRELADMYARVGLLAGISFRTQEFESLLDQINKIIKERGRKPSRDPAVLVVTTAAGQQLDTLLQTLRTQYLLNPEYGLDGFLSVRVRHGSLVGTLRSQLEQRQLLTKQDGVTGVYENNDHWLDPSVAPGDREGRVHLSYALSHFSEEFDRLLYSINDDLMHVRSDEKPRGMFDLSVREFLDALKQISGVNSRDLPRLIDEGLAFDDFLQTCFQALWYALSRSLRAVRDYLDTDVRSEINNLFTQLREKVSSICGPRGAELYTELVSASTDVQTALTSVKEWFVGDPARENRTSFSLEDVVKMARDIAHNIHQGFTFQINLDEGVKARVRSDQLARVLDIFNNAFDNVYAHAGWRDGSTVDISVVETKVDQLKLRISNGVLLGTVNSVVEAKLGVIRSEIATGEYRNRLRAEGGSGLIKIMRAALQLNGNDLVFGFAQEKFFLEVVVGLETQPASASLGGGG